MPTRRHAILWPCLVLTALAAASARPAAAQQVRWLTDYTAARKEAAEKGRPILLDFGTEGCVWCKRLDASTFRDPALVAMLAAKFVAMKLAAARAATLPQPLRVPQSPTLVLAWPDGKILGALEGYQEAPRLLEQLQKVSAAYATPD